MRAVSLQLLGNTFQAGLCDAHGEIPRGLGSELVCRLLETHLHHGTRWSSAVVTMINGHYVSFPALSNTNYVYDNFESCGCFWIIRFVPWGHNGGNLFFFFPLIPEIPF